MKLVLLRHATRSPHHFGDSPLTAIGRTQAEDLAQRLAPQGNLPQPTRLLCSPKRRARETMAPLASVSGLPLTIDARLDERHQNETASEFETRVRQILDEAASEPDAAKNGEREACLYLCSHLDWLEAALVMLPSDLTELEVASSFTTAEFKVFKLQDGLWQRIGSGRGKETAG